MFFFFFHAHFQQQIHVVRYLSVTVELRSKLCIAVSERFGNSLCRMRC